jgi:hypothetical protein
LSVGLVCPFGNTQRQQAALLEPRDPHLVGPKNRNIDRLPDVEMVARLSSQLSSLATIGWTHRTAGIVQASRGRFSFVQELSPLLPMHLWSGDNQPLEPKEAGLPNMWQTSLLHVARRSSLP